MRMIRRFNWIEAIFLAAIAGLGTAQTGNATIVTWTTAGGGSWNSGANWSTNPNLPTAADAATFDATLPNATNVITLDANQTVYAVNLVGGTGAKIVNINAGTPA